jgi:hypothetical protein
VVKDLTCDHCEKRGEEVPMTILSQSSITSSLNFPTISLSPSIDSNMMLLKNGIGKINQR